MTGAIRAADRVKDRMDVPRVHQDRDPARIGPLDLVRIGPLGLVPTVPLGRLDPEDHRQDQHVRVGRRVHHASEDRHLVRRVRIGHRDLALTDPQGRRAREDLALDHPPTSAIRKAISAVGWASSEPPPSRTEVERSKG